MNDIFKKCSEFMTPEKEALLLNLGKLFLRVSFGLTMAFSHGFGKVKKFIAGGEIQFPDPLGIGASSSLLLAGYAEFLCALLVVVGVGTRVSSLQVAFTMGVAAFVIHGADPFAKKEFALIYLFAFLTITLIGPGKYAVESYFCKACKKN